MNHNEKPNTKSMKAGPLHGVKVLDLTSVVLGPLATQVLGDYGADVLKIEGLEGDHARSRGVQQHENMGSVFLAVNRNKKSVAINLKTEQGKEVVLKLIEDSDIFVHNMRPQAINRLGLSYKVVSKINKKIIYCSATAFDQDGPYKDKPAFDDIIQSASGMVDLNARALKLLEYIPSLIADKAAGLVVVNAILAALYYREKTGNGQELEVPMFETVVAFNLVEHLAGKTFSNTDLPAGYSRLLETGRKPVKTLDGMITVLPYTAKHWRKLFEATDRAELVDEYCTDNRQARADNIPLLYEELDKIVSDKTTSDIVSLCHKLDIPYSEIYSLEDLIDHPQLVAISAFETIEVASLGEIRYMKPTTKFEKTPAVVRQPPPNLGQHTKETILNAGYSEKMYEVLLEKGIVFQCH